MNKKPKVEKFPIGVGYLSTMEAQDNRKAVISSISSLIDKSKSWVGNPKALMVALIILLSGR